MQFEQLQKDMIAAMKARDKERKAVLSSLLTALKNFQIDKRQCQSCGIRFLSNTEKIVYLYIS